MIMTRLSLIESQPKKVIIVVVVVVFVVFVVFVEGGGGASTACLHSKDQVGRLVCAYITFGQ